MRDHFPHERIGTNEVTPVTVTEQIHRITVDEYVRIVHDLGWHSTELVEGVVYDVTPEKNRHAGTVDRVFRLVDAAFVGDITRCVGSVRLGPYSLFEPDVFVLGGAAHLDPDEYVAVTDVKLVVEVSVTTQAHDRGPKLIAYAKAGVAEVWLIDPRPGVGELTRYRDPDGASFMTVDRFDVGEDALALEVGEILAR
jgi:Uma2 family endonuclease